MIFQWQLFVLVGIVGIFVYINRMYTVVISNGKKEYRYMLLPTLFIAFPLIYLAATRNDNIGDTYAYRQAFINMPSTFNEVFGYITENMKDKGFVVFSILIKSVIGNRDVLYFAIIATICILCVVLTYKKYSCSFILSVFLFIASGDYIQWTFNGMRQFIAASILFASTGLMLKKIYIPVIFFILILSTIHASALVMLPIIFIVQGPAWNKKTVGLLIVVLLGITFIDQFTDLLTNIMENTQYSSEVEQFLSTEGTSILRVIVYSIPAIIALIFNKRIRVESNPVIDMCVGMSIVTMGVYLISAFTSGIFIGRIPIYFSLYNYMLLPWEIKTIFERKSASCLNVIMIICYLIFYYYQVEITWKL